jgi:hypothetical protein
MRCARRQVQALSKLLGSADLDYARIRAESSHNGDEVAGAARNTTFGTRNRWSTSRRSVANSRHSTLSKAAYARVPHEISVTAQLIDACTGTHVWAQSYERSTASTSLLSIQDDVAHWIGATIGDTRTGAVARAELDRIRRNADTNLVKHEVGSTASPIIEPTTRLPSSATVNSSGCTASFAGIATSTAFHAGLSGKTSCHREFTPSKYSDLMSSIALAPIPVRLTLQA